MTFEDAPVPYFGRAGDGSDARTDHATLVQFLDPETGEFEYAISY